MAKKQFSIRFVAEEIVEAESAEEAHQIAKKRFFSYDPKVFIVEEALLEDVKPLPNGGCVALFREDWNAQDRELDDLKYKK